MAWQGRDAGQVFWMIMMFSWTGHSVLCQQSMTRFFGLLVWKLTWATDRQISLNTEDRSFPASLTKAEHVDMWSVFIVVFVIVEGDGLTVCQVWKWNYVKQCKWTFQTYVKMRPATFADIWKLHQRRRKQTNQCNMLSLEGWFPTLYLLWLWRMMHHYISFQGSMNLVWLNMMFVFVLFCFRIHYFNLHLRLFYNVQIIVHCDFRV